MKTRLSLSLILLVASFTACDKTLDVNTNPLSPSTPELNQMLTGVLVRYSDEMLAELGIGTLDIYHHTSSTINSVATGSVNSYAITNVWFILFGRALGNLKSIEKEAIAKRESHQDLQAVALTLEAMAFFDLTSVFESVPFAEALDYAKYPTPKFDSQEEILDGIVTMLDRAIALIEKPKSAGLKTFDFSKGDILLKGDMARWKSFANGLRIRTLMLIRNVPARKADAEQKLANAFNAPLPTSAIYIGYAGDANARNPYGNLIVKYFSGINTALGPSPVIRNLLLDNNDPRAQLWFVKPTNPDLEKVNKEKAAYKDYPTAEYGYDPTENRETLYSNTLIRADQPDVWMLPGEFDFYKAELLLSGAPGISGSAQDSFEQGVRKTLRYWGREISGFKATPVTDAEITAFITGLGAVTLQKIYEQLWLESMFRPVLAWNTVRRTGVPKLNPPPSANNITTILKRYPVSPDEAQANPKAPESKRADAPMWFENR